MKSIVKEKWIKALTSGEYTQGEGYLEYEEEGVRKNCCLGVLCRIQGEQPEKDSLSDKFYLYDNQVAIPSDNFLAKVDLAPNEANRLAEMNDDGHSFEEIAEFIDLNL